MTSKKQIFARQRNWAKARVLGMTFDLKLYTSEEAIIVKKMEALKKELIKNWDLESLKLGLKPSKFEIFEFGDYTHYATQEPIVIGDFYIRLGYREVFRGSGFLRTDYKVVASTDPSIQFILDVV